MSTHQIDIDGTIVPYASISRALHDQRVVSVKRADDPQVGLFRVREECDSYFRVYLTREQLHAWADELHRVADGLPPVDTVVVQS